MTWEIALIIALLIGALVSFAMERVPADQTAITLLIILLAAGILTPAKAFTVFANAAPLTVAAMFVLSAALERCGIIDSFAGLLGRATRFGYLGTLGLMFLVVAGLSAFINNTPVVVIFLPVMMSLAKKVSQPASRFLIPLSYAAIAGGTCTLIGTSTNILVSGILVQNGERPLSMFELAHVGVPLAGITLFYLLAFGKRLLPVRESLTSILSEEERREYITEAYVTPESAVIGSLLAETSLLKSKAVRLIEVVRDGIPLQTPVNEIRFESGDRLILACRPSGVAHARSIEGLDFTAELNLGLGQIAAHEGAIIEGIVSQESELIGRNLKDSNFRQRYRMIVLAVHRRGRNVREAFANVPLEFGDTLLMVGPTAAIQRLRGGRDILLFDQPHVPAESTRTKAPIVIGVGGAAIGIASMGWMPIEVTALTACVIFLWTRCLTIAEAYKSIQWNILFLIYGTLALGLAMDETGAAKLLATGLIDFISNVAPPEHKMLILLACVYLLTTTLTEVLSNNAGAVLMGTLAFGVTAALNVDPRPFLVAVALGASASFATPIGYQTNTYVYGAGGYRFSDFCKIGIPLNLLYFIGSMLIIPRVWPLG